jgi:hypothetical protein
MLFAAGVKTTKENVSTLRKTKAGVKNIAKKRPAQSAGL